MAVFGPKIGRFSRVFKNLLEFDKIHWNTLLVQKWGHLERFWPFYGHLKSRFGHFSLYISIGKIALGNQTCPHVLVSGAFRVDFLYKHMVYRCEALEILYAIVPE